MKEILGAVIVNYNDDNRVIALVEKILNEGLIDKIAVVDNGSQQESKDKLNSFFHPYFDKVNLVFNSQNLGFNKATNQGFRLLDRLGCSFVFAINSDVDVSSEIRMECVKLLLQEPKLALTSCRRMEYGKEKQFYYNFPTIHSEINNDLGITKLFHIKPKIREKNENYSLVDFIRFSFVCIRMSALKKVDFLDDHTFLYFGEARLAKKFLKSGYREACLNKYTCQHNHIYKKGYRINGYHFTYKESLYYFSNYTKANQFQLFLLKVAYKCGIAIRKVLRIH